MKFRDLKKEALRVSVPPEFDPAIRIAAAHAKMTRSEWLTRVLCEALDLDPETYGLDGAVTIEQPAAQPA